MRLTRQRVPLLARQNTHYQPHPRYQRLYDMVSMFSIGPNYLSVNHESVVCLAMWLASHVRTRSCLDEVALQDNMDACSYHETDL